MNQSVAGLGNIYVNEVLYLSRTSEKRVFTHNNEIRK